MFRRTFKKTTNTSDDNDKAITRPQPTNESESFNDGCETLESNFRDLPEPVLLNILYYLQFKDILAAGRTCQRWNRITKDDWLWRRLFQRDFNLPTNVKIGIRPGR